MIEKGKLILSPQAGFGNRMRMLCSGIVLAEVLGREPLYYWPGGEASRSNTLDHIRAMREEGFHAFFLLNQGFMPIDLNPSVKIDLSLSEWLPGEFWYPYQSSAHQAWEGLPQQRLGAEADELRRFDDLQTILIESSRALTLHDYTRSEWHAMMTQTYQAYFQPQTIYQEILAEVPYFDMGVAIRRREFMHYFPETAQSEAELSRWLDQIIEAQAVTSLVLFSDDHALRDRFRHRLQKRGINCPDLRWGELKRWQVSFLEFLTLATRVSDVIYGTVKSSFAEQAAIYGGVPYAPICKNK
ncbi:hypothetical protein IC620_11225 [Hazenella sp. IB182357]|uniref:Uncharacterized protein n=1 Tax=Polycladospora coralii TaxID=2771432 RepID=A0A926RUG1_9BACL|nr:hypothetical protein [Polycladospora coralii]MBD1372928.1 hypothetical protein [Polycladospora coralii]